MLTIRETKDSAIFDILVVPKSSRCELTGIQKDALKLKITAPPVNGKANEECIRFLADKLNIKKSRIAIIAGHKSKRKTIAVFGLKSKDVEAIISS